MNSSYLVKIGLEEVHALGVFEQTRPVLLLDLLLAQDQGNIASGMNDLGFLRVDLCEELKVDSVGQLLGCGSALERQ